VVDQPEALQEKRRLISEGDAATAARAALDLGVYYLNLPGQSAEAESLLRQAIAKGDPSITPIAQVNLAGALQSQNRYAEAEAAYREVIAFSDVTASAAAVYGLGQLLALQPTRLAEAESVLRQSVETGDAENSARAGCALGELLMSQPGRLSDAQAVLAKVTTSGHAEYAPRAWYDSGLIFSQSNDRSQAEQAFFNAFSSNHPEIAPRAAFNLGLLFSQSPERLPAAEFAFGLAIKFQHPDQSPLAATTLGDLLADVPERRKDAEAAYRVAIDFGNPAQTPAAAYNLGVLLLADVNRRSDAEAAFRIAASSSDREHAPLALYNLGRLLGEDPTRWPEARQALEAAVATGDDRVIEVAANLLPQLDPSGLPERLVPVLDDSWQCVKVASQDGFYIEEYLPASESMSDWSTIVTATQIVAPLSPGDYMSLVRRQFEGSVIDGRLSWEVLTETENELLYESTVEDDIAAMDQNEVSRIVRHGDRLFTIQHSMRGDLALAAKEKPVRLELLRSASFERLPAPATAVSVASDDAVAAKILEGATAPSAEAIDVRLTRYRQGLEKITKEGHPFHWALLNFQIGLSIIQQPQPDSANDDDLDQATAALRRSLEVYKKDQAADVWGRALHALGQVAFERAQRHGRIADPASQEIVQNSLRHAIAAFDQSRRVFQPGSFEWARSTVDLGDAQLSVEVGAAAATYKEAIEKLENMPPLPEQERSGELGTELANLIIRATVGLQSIDRLKAGEPVAPARFLESRKRGKVLYLRPLLTAGSLRLANQSVQGDFKIGFAKEPEEITLEALLYRALGADLNFYSLGGRPEGYGGTRIFMAAGGTDWKSGLPILEESADLVLMVPHKSEGVRWELDFLAERKALGKTLFIMPPLSFDTDTAAMWNEGALLMSKHGLHFPEYDSWGGIYRFAADGAIADQWDFDCVWKNDLLQAIDHLLPGAKGS
jgi:tetratricopeptide (TPR) repeat protein